MDSSILKWITQVHGTENRLSSSQQPHKFQYTSNKTKQNQTKKKKTHKKNNITAKSKESSLKVLKINKRIPTNRNTLQQVRYKTNSKCVIKSKYKLRQKQTKKNTPKTKNTQICTQGK